MKSRIVICVAFVLCVSLTMFATPGAVRCGKLLDVRSGRMLADQVIVFDGGVITTVGAAASTPIPAGVQALDLSSATCMPGFIDVHTHITSNPQDSGYKGLEFRFPAKRRLESATHARRCMPDSRRFVMSAPTGTRMSQCAMA